MKTRLDDHIEIARYIDECSTEEVDIELIEDNYRGCYAILKEVNISDLSMGPEDNHLTDKKKQSKYNKMTPETCPPIVIEGNKIIDGHHRVRAMLQNKVKTIMAYVIFED